MAIGKILKAGVKAGVKKTGRGTRPGKANIDAPKDLKAAKAKTGTKSTKTVKRSEAPIQSERSKITAANAAAKTRRAKAAGKTAGVSATRNTTNRVLPVGSKRAIGTAGVASAAAIGTLNKKKPAAKKETFADAFRKARAKGEGTKFTHNGKSYVAVTKTDLKKKGYDDNELAAYNKRGGKARGPLNRLGQKAKKVLLGKDKKFGGDKGAIDFIRKPKKKAGGGMMKSKGMRAGGSVQKMKGGGKVKRLATGVARRAYQAKTLPVQAAARAAEKIAPGSKAARGLQKVARPFKGGGMVKSKGMKAGGAMKSKGYARGGAMKSKATGAAKRGFGKAYMKGKR